MVVWEDVLSHCNSFSVITSFVQKVQKLPSDGQCKPFGTLLRFIRIILPSYTRFQMISKNLVGISCKLPVTI